MEKDRINFLLQNPSEATKNDLVSLQEETGKYTYSQVLHILCSKIGYSIEDQNKNKLLNTAAIFASNRANLQKIIEGIDYLENLKEKEVFQELKIEDPADENQDYDRSLDPEDKEHKVVDSSSIFEEVIKNLQKLKSLRKQFLFLDSEESSHENNEEVSEEIDFKPQDDILEKPAQKKSKKSSKKEPKTKKRKLDEIMKKDLEIDSQVNHFFISEIEHKSTPKEEKPAVNKSQIEIIDKFILNQPSIGNINDEIQLKRDEGTKDLSIKSTLFGDNLVSENLAIILLKQGKKEKAIDIYRKLIWKLPQKKAYFAARIEEIKK